MTENKFKIAVLIPTRGRTEALLKAVTALVDHAQDKESIQVLFGFDKDDKTGTDYFKTTIRPYLESVNVAFSASLFHPLGYQGLNVYYNTLAEKIDSDWLMLYSDDAIMDTCGWDTVITSHTGEFTLLKVHTHNEHPYSIFPIYPKEWYDLFQFCSVQQMVDAELSHIAYPLDLVQVVNINIIHDRYDLTGNNLDDTEINRVRFEGNPSDPRDFMHMIQLQHRERSMFRIAEYLREKGHDMTFWDNVLARKQDPFEKMHKNDINKFLGGARVVQQ